MTLQNIQRPIVFAAKNAKKVATSPDGKEQYWTADIKAVRREVFNIVYENVLFIETPGEMVFLAGIENPDGIDRRIQKEIAEEQAKFISFLREENEKDNNRIGILRLAFTGHEYATVAKATAAYMAIRNLTHPFGVGFFNNENEYEHLAITPGEESGFDGNMYLSFDELGS